MEFVFKSFQVVFWHAFHYERPVDCSGQLWDHEIGNKSVDYCAKLYLLGFVG